MLHTLKNMKHFMRAYLKAIRKFVNRKRMMIRNAHKRLIQDKLAGSTNLSVGD